ncbi:ABC transporter substrate-binding protein [Agromyces sp. LHK192]|uniref:ABC transporter substrate-binding protein n=1 Tax=Agromyces sp. LHK192 TaxID=2498704 RepID=UPI000FD8616E|nr:extracellular solute-binding protein [Agromyces sp. LHK192]
MRSAKVLTGLGLAAVTALGLAACSGGSAPETPASDIELRMTVWTSNEDHLALFDSIADAYMEDHPEVTGITFDPLPFEDYTTTLTTQVAGGSAPDLAWILENAAPDFVQSGALLPLDDTLSADPDYGFDDLSESATALWHDDSGSLVAYPFSTSPFVMFANDDLLKQAGLPTAAEMQANGDWNWDAVSDAGAAVHSSTGKAGFVIRDFDYTTWDNLASVWMGWGAAPWSEDGATCTFDSPEMVEAFEFLHDAAFAKQSMPGPGTTADFFAGESAFTVTQISRASLLKGDFAWNLLPLPEGPEGEYSMIGQAGIGVLADGADAQAAADFLAFFTNPENSEQLAQYFPPPRESQLNTETLAATNPTLTPEQIEDVVIPGIQTGVVRPSHTDSAEIGQEVRSALDALWVADADIPGTLGDVCTAIDPLLG